MKLRFIDRPNIDAYDGAFVARHREDEALIVDQLYCPCSGQGRMTAVMRRYLRRLPDSVATVWVQAHPYRCEDTLPWPEVVRFARWLSRLGFRLQDRRAFFSRLREVARNNEGYIRFGAIQDDAWMVLER